MATQTCGAFTLDLSTGQVSGPRAYLESDQFKALIAHVMAGGDPCGARRFSPDAPTALLVTIQTDYAGWLGMETFNRARGI